MAKHIQEQKMASLKQQQEAADLAANLEDDSFDLPKVPQPKAIATAKSVESTLTKKMVYLAYSYRGVVPTWVKPLKEALESHNYIAFSPLESVEEQFQKEDKQVLFGLKSKLVSSVVGFLKLPEDIIAPLESQSVIQSIRLGDQKADIDSMLFKEVYFLTRSAVVIVDLIQEPYGMELLHKLFICKILDIPTIAISPKGAPLNPYVSKFIKVVLTDEFNVANILPLVKAYT